jgi:hypothetical protein
MYNVFHLTNDYSEELAATAPSFDAAREWCSRDTARHFWKKHDGITVTANEHREPIHVIRRS